MRMLIEEYLVNILFKNGESYGNLNMNAFVVELRCIGITLRGLQ